MHRKRVEYAVVITATMSLFLQGCICFHIGKQGYVDSSRPCAKKIINIPPDLPQDLTAQQVKDALESHPGYMYLDVRTEAEFIAGHIPTSINIPVMTRDTQTGKMALNNDFLPMVQKRIHKNTKLIVGCQSGGRSAKAQAIMQDAGYRHVTNMLGGFYGKKNKAGDVIYPGWSMLGYPVDRGGSDRGLNTFVARLDH